MTSSEEQSEVVFEEDEVVWAKIRGYPWWPAFIDKAETHPKREETEYTVFFFGDNTHAKLGSLKLRKFVEFYVEFYQKAKTNRKLMLSIQKAEEKLRQNEQNTDIFRELRNSIKNKKEHPKPIGGRGSAISELDDFEQERLPQLVKSKTSKSNSIQQRRLQAEEPSSQSESSPKSVHSNIKQAKPTHIVRRRGRRPKQIARQEKIFQQDESESVRDKKIEVEQRIIGEEDHMDGRSQKQGQNRDEQDHGELMKSEMDEDYAQKLKASEQIQPRVPRRRGRPKKIQVISNQASSQPGSKGFPKRKPIKKPSQSAQSSPTRRLVSRSSEDILDDIKNLLDSREELIDYLDTIKITPSNAKQILDLEVGNILQSGPMDYKVRNILSLLKSSLLLKYFPDDSKNIRNYQKLARNRPQIIDGLKQEKSKEVSQPEHPLPMDIRKKTIIKIQKFLKGDTEAQSKAKEWAIKIQSYFQSADRSVGSKYKTMAYKVLSALRDRRQSFSEIMRKLENNAFD